MAEITRTPPEVRPSEDRFRLMAEVGPSITWTAAADGTVTYVSDVWYRYTGLRRDQDVRGWSRSVLHPDDAQRTIDAWQRSLALGVEHEVEARHLRHDGIYRWFVTRAIPSKDANGRVTQWFGSTTDIDDYRQSRDAMRFLAQASAELAQVGDYETTLGRIATLAVPFFADWFGVHIREADGHIRRLAVRHLDPARERQVETLYREYPPTEGRPYGGPAVIETGAAIWAPRFDEAAVSAARDERHLRLLRELGLRAYICVPMRSRGIVLGALTFATAESRRDYSDIHLRAAEDLANRAAVAIENAQLLERLREADRRKDEFLAVLAHELRNPLAPVRNAVQILRDKAAWGPESQWASDLIERQVRQMSRLVDDLLDVSRITSGKIELRTERVALGTVVASAVEASRTFFERGRQELSVEVTPEPVYLEADITRLSQVISNLLNNAAKYTQPGGHVRLAIACEGEHAVIRVRDNGIGIPQPMLERVFDMFTQLDRGTDYSQGGLGIGLTLVKQLVELHGGTVTAHSEGGGLGSEFVVRLPVSAAAQDSPVPSLPFEGHLPRGEGVKILVVDDNRDAADSLAYLLKFTGNEVRTAYDGFEAVGAALAFHPDVVLLDIGLPKLYGYDVARRIREARGERVLIVAVTGWGQEEDRRRSREAGFDHHLTKPVDLPALLELIRTETARASAAP